MNPINMPATKYGSRSTMYCHVMPIVTSQKDIVIQQEVKAESQRTPAPAVEHIGQCDVPCAPHKHHINSHDVTHKRASG